MARWLMVSGVLLLTTGMILHFAPWLLSWFGQLPGDITIRTARARVFMPITSTLVVSLLLSLIVNLFRHLF